MKYKYWLACMAQMAENIGTGKVENCFALPEVQESYMTCQKRN